MDFQRFGNGYHPRIRNAADLREAGTLDESLWVATSAPIPSFRMDPVFLDFLDSDSDGRVKCGEFIEAITWIFDLLATDAPVTRKEASLSADTLSDTPDAEEIRRLIHAIGDSTGSVSLERIRRCRKELESRPVSESGVVLPDAVENEDYRTRLETVLSILPGVSHPSGSQGVTLETLDQLTSAVSDRLSWLNRVETNDASGRSIILALGNQTEAAYLATRKVQEKIDQYFQLCDMVDLDPGLSASLWPGLELPPERDNPEALAEAIRKAPLAHPSSDRILTFSEEVNPAWEYDLHVFRQQVMVPLLDRTDEVLTLETWRTIQERLAPYESWKQSEPATEFSSVPSETLGQLSDPEFLNAVRQLINSQSTDPLTLKQVRLAEKASLFQAHLLNFANNFIAFPFLYDSGNRAGFEMGTLIMDGRLFSLSIRVRDRKQYINGIDGGTMFIMIVALEHKQRGETMDVAVPVTYGKQGNLKLGKHGVFQHVDGSQWFATIAHITDNPVSLGEAMVEPFKRLGSAVTRKVESMTQAAEKKLDAVGGQAVSNVPTAAPTAPAAPGGGMLAGGGIAIAAMGSSLAFITKIFAGLELVGILKGLGVAILAVLIPSLLIAWLRLRKRDLSVLLEGADWAMNSRMRLSRAQCRAFTRDPTYPKESRFHRGREWWLWRIFWILLLATVLIYSGT